MLFDTNAVSDLFCGEPALGKLLERHPDHYFPSVVIGEYLHGLKKSKRRAILLPAFEAFLATGIVLDVTVETARHYALLAAEQDHKGQPVPANDLWIAALAREHHLPILTRDAHFKVMDGIESITW